MKALLSVSDKTGITEFAKGLVAAGYEILSTGGTAKALRGAGIKVTDVSDYTGFPEIMGGRVKTLHPKVHGGLLAVRGNKEHERQMKENGIDAIGLVAVNLYPFEETVKKGGKLGQVIENIDIGGPSMLRSAAKNYESVVVVCGPERYGQVLEEIKAGGVKPETRKKLAVEAFAHTARYDTIISNYLGEEELPETLNLTFDKIQKLRYGENPHQKAAFYREAFAAGATVSTAKQLHGKELSFNNIYDLNSALELVKEFGGTAVVILKHNNPCGVGIDRKQAEAYRKAMECDPVSAFGGIVAVNAKLELATAEEITKTFIECVIAPGYDKDALEHLKSKKKNLRVLEVPKFGKEPKAMTLKKVAGGVLLQGRDQELFAGLKVATKRKPGKEEMKALEFAMKVCKHVKSNAIIYAMGDRTIGIGAGQMSRVDSAVVGAMKAKNAGLDTRGSVLASDAFFPFRDAVDAAAKAGVTAIIQPGGSIRDEEVIGACDEHGIAMVFTGMRHFNH
ncbi:MAG: bifunctional phosphoribosylaminoimidazolecarboxamide formyltransferase/IMP cyclohydrolase [Candidatus Diapherotrites archaeon]|nr:bifunctional phosphoribosylaminoimidazolecarboxamide formyltransferase/IMP cyclohydrolase [Candidatus Diapherotrites archaeon]